MPESTLSLSVDDLKSEIGFYLGYGYGPKFGMPEWSPQQSETIGRVLKMGLSQVYTPPPLRPGEASHRWSFLRPSAQIVLPSGASSVTLPDDFGGFEDDLVISSPDSSRRLWKVRLANVGYVDEQYSSRPTATGPPQVACERVKAGSNVSRSSRSELYVWPTADQAYTFTVTYKHLQNALEGGHKYPPGGAEHSELFKASCLAAAEIQLDDSQGPRWTYFMQRLEASVHADRKRKGNWIGYNGDNSGSSLGAKLVRSRRYFYGPPVTYNGNPMG